MKIGMKMTMISVHSSGQPRMKMMNWLSSMNCSGVMLSESTHCSTRFCPPSNAKAAERNKATIRLWYDEFELLVETENGAIPNAYERLIKKYGITNEVCLYSERNLFMLLLEAGASVLRTLTTTHGNVKAVGVRV